MDYTISEDRLFEVFSHYMEKRFGELKIEGDTEGDTEGDLVYSKKKDGEVIYWGLFDYVRSAGQFMFIPYSRNSQLFDNLKNTFGDVFDDMFLKYLQTKFPEYNIEGMY